MAGIGEYEALAVGAGASVSWIYTANESLPVLSAESVTVRMRRWNASRSTTGTSAVGEEPMTGAQEVASLMTNLASAVRPGSGSQVQAQVKSASPSSVTVARPSGVAPANVTVKVVPVARSNTRNSGGASTVGESVSRETTRSTSEVVMDGRNALRRAVTRTRKNISPKPTTAGALKVAVAEALPPALV